MPIFIHLLQLLLSRLDLFGVLIVIKFEDFGTLIRLSVVLAELTELSF